MRVKENGRRVSSVSLVPRYSQQAERVRRDEDEQIEEVKRGTERLCFSDKLIYGSTVPALKFFNSSHKSGNLASSNVIRQHKSK